MNKRMIAATLCVVTAAGCAQMDAKTESAAIGAGLGCAAGAVVAALTKNDAGTACAAGAIVGGLIGYQRARSAEISEAQKATEAVSHVEGAKVAPVQTEQVQVTDRKENKTEKVEAFKSVSVDIPVRQLNTAEGREAVRKLDEYARKTAEQRGEVIDVTIATAPASGASGTEKVALKQTVEVAGKGKVRRTQMADPKVPANVQRITIEARNQSKIEV